MMICYTCRHSDNVTLPSRLNTKVDHSASSAQLMDDYAFYRAEANICEVYNGKAQYRQNGDMAI